MGIDINKYFPYNKMRVMTVDGQQVVRIPKIYVKNEVIPSGQFAGKTAYFMAEHCYKGYHIHPAFMFGGTAMSALDLSCYQASRDRNGKPASIPNAGFWQGVNLNDATRYCLLRNTGGDDTEQWGWHIWDIYCQHLLARLMLFEFGTTGFSSQESTLPEFVYRGIHQPAGDPLYPTWLPGIKNIGGTIYVADNLGEGAMLNTGLKSPGVGWPTHFSMKTGNQFDLGDLFIADKVSNKEIDGTCSDWQRFDRPGNNEICYITVNRGHTDDPVNSHGMFAISATGTLRGAATSTWACVGSGCNPLRFRLARYVK